VNRIYANYAGFFVWAGLPRPCGARNDGVGWSVEQGFVQGAAGLPSLRGTKCRGSPGFAELLRGGGSTPSLALPLPRGGDWWCCRLRRVLDWLDGHAPAGLAMTAEVSLRRRACGAQKSSKHLPAATFARPHVAQARLFYQFGAGAFHGAQS